MPYEPTKLVLQRDAFEGLHRALERRRGATAKVTIPAGDLIALLSDYATLLHRFKLEG